MILVVAIALGLAAGLARGGRLNGLAELPIRWLWLALLGFALEFVCVKLGVQGSLFSVLTPFLAGALVVAGFAVANLRLPGMPLILVGLTMNALAMAANGGYMPSTPAALAEAGYAQRVAVNGVGRPLPNSKEIVLPAGETRLWPLTDIWVSPPIPPFRFVFSPGDVLLALGGAYFAYAAVRTPRRNPTSSLVGRAAPAPRD